MSRTRSAGAEQLALIVTELTLAAVTLAVIVSFERLFADDAWRRPVILAALIAHATAMLLRRLPVPGFVSAPLFVAGGAVAITRLLYPDTTWWGLPSSETLDALRPDLEVASDTFPDAIAPTVAIPGFVVVVAAAIWLLAGLADSVAFRSRRALLALAPMAAVVIFVAAVGSEQRRTPLLLLAMTAALVFIVTHRSLLYPAEHTWLGNLTDARAAMARFAAPIATIAGVFTVTMVPLVPGATESLVDLDTGGPGDPARVVISPLVDIQARLVNQQDVEVFQVRSPEPAYWRLTSLDTFNNQVWSSRADYGNASGDLDLVVDSGSTTRDITQQYRVQALAAVWLPAAFQPTSISNLTDVELSWEPESATLIVDRGTPDSDGIEYTIDSAIPEFSADRLAALPAGHPAEFDRFTELPDDFSPVATDVAVQVAGNATTPYEMSMALQQFFRSEFTYDLNVAAGHDISRIEDFLTLRAGYCEQFAGSFAAMARSLGLPARVAVGFTWGDSDPTDPTLYRVRGEHAHAWPEVYIDGAGWVAFEPTPGRGAPGAEYTQVGAAQDETGPSEETAGSPLNPAIPDIPPDVADRLAQLDEQGSSLAPGTGEGTETDTGVMVPTWAIVIGIVLLGVLVVIAALPFARRAIRHRRYHGVADETRRRILDAWSAVVESMGSLGIRPRDSETSGEFVNRVVPVLGPQPELRNLASSVDQARYSADSMPDASALQAETAAERLTGQVRDRTSWWDRYRAELEFGTSLRRR